MIESAHQILASCETSQAATQVCQHDSSGPGAALRIFVILAIIGIVVLGWLLLRGYQGNANASGEAGGSDGTSPPPAEPAAGDTVPADHTPR